MKRSSSAQRREEARKAVAELVGAAAALKKAQKQAQATASQAEQARYDAAEAALVQLWCAGEQLVRVELLLAGFSYPRHSARRRRMTTPPADPPILDPEVQSQLQAILQRAEQGDQTVLPELRQLLDENPQAWQRIGDLGQQAQEAWLNLITGSNLIDHESLARQVQELRAELAGSDPSCIERLLVARVLMCWLQMHHADVSAALLKDGPPAQHTVFLRRHSAAQSRYLEAIKCLQKVRREGTTPVDFGRERRAGKSAAASRSPQLKPVSEPVDS